MKEIIKKLHDSSLVQNLFYLYAAHIARFIFPLITIPYLARILGTGNWGVILYFQAVSMYFAVVLEFGFGLSATRKISQERNSFSKLSTVFSNVISAQVSLLLIILVSSLFLYRNVGIFNDNPKHFFWALLMGSTQGLNLYWFFRGVEKIKIVATLDFFSKLVATVAIFIIVRGPNDSWYVFVCYSLANLLALSVSYFLVDKEIRFSFSSVIEIINELKESFNLFLIRVGALMFSLGTVLILGFYLDPVKLVLFATAERIINAIRSFIAPAVDAIFPRMAYNAAHHKEKRVLQIAKVLKYFSLAGACMSLLTFIFAPLIVNIILGESYNEAIPVLRAFSGLPLVLSVSLVFGANCLIPCGYYKEVCYTSLFGGLLNVGLTLIAVHENLDLVYFAFINVFTQFIVGIILFLYIRKYHLMHWRRSI